MPDTGKTPQRNVKPPDGPPNTKREQQRKGRTVSMFDPRRGAPSFGIISLMPAYGVIRRARRPRVLVLKAAGR